MFIGKKKYLKLLKTLEKSNEIAIELMKSDKFFPLGVDGIVYQICYRDISGKFVSVEDDATINNVLEFVPYVKELRLNTENFQRINEKYKRCSELTHIFQTKEEAEKRCNSITAQIKHINEERDCERL